MKGSKREEEESLNALKLLNSKIEKIDVFSLPKEESMRTLYVIKKSEKTSSKYPRKYADMKKKPL